jgi:hypothetical protein
MTVVKVIIAFANTSRATVSLAETTRTRSSYFCESATMGNNYYNHKQQQQQQTTTN